MPPTLTEEALPAFESQPEFSLRTQDPFAGLESEHITIGDEYNDPDRQPNTVSRQLRIRNSARGIASELTFYREGFLRIREGTRKTLQKDHTIDLRFVDPNAVFRRHVASGWLWACIAISVCAFAARVFLPLSTLSGVTLPVTVILATAAAVTFLAFIYKSEERIRFTTANGRADVVLLVASFGCLFKVRRAARDIKSAIKAEVANLETGKEPYLRAEMQAHYRLKESDVISARACSDGTARILARFG